MKQCQADENDAFSLCPDTAYWTHKESNQVYIFIIGIFVKEFIVLISLKGINVVKSLIILIQAATCVRSRIHSRQRTKLPRLSTALMINNQLDTRRALMTTKAI